MRELYTTPIGFVHAVRYRDAMLRAWAARTGHTSKSGWTSYRPEEVPEYIDPPTNEQRSLAEVHAFTLYPLKHGKPYYAYLSNDRRITTWMGDTLATVTKITSYRAYCFGHPHERGTFWAIGIDGRTYYGRHNGTGMHCRMRLAKWQDEYDVQQCGPEGWETVTSATTHSAAREHLREYRENAPQFPYRIKRRKVRQP